MIGIYKISIGPYFYYGQSTNLQRRFNSHRQNLESSIHSNKFLQHIYDKHQTIKFQVLLTECQESELNMYEQRLLDRFIDDPHCMNLARFVDAPARGMKHFDEAKAKISAAGTGNAHTKGHELSEEHKARISVALIGYKHSDETKAKISATLKGREHSDETKAKLSFALKGRKLSDEHKAKLSAAKIGNINAVGHRKSF